MEPTASQCYETRFNRIRASLDELRDQLTLHAAQQEVHPGDWGFAGDLAHVDVALADLVRFLAGEE